MASRVSTNQRATEESQQGGLLQQLLKTNNIFLFVPNIIGKQQKGY